MSAEDNLDLPSASLAILRERARLLQMLRAFFDERGFFEVQTPLLSADTVVEQHLDPLRVRLYDDPRTIDRGPTWYLQTSPEFHMKRLLVAGAEAIYQVASAFRAAERGSLHNPEFTMVEWYRCNQDLDAGIRLLDELCQHMLGGQAAEHITYAEAFRRHADIDPFTCTDSELVERIGNTVPGTTPLSDRDDQLNFLLTELVEPQLGQSRPTILYDYPPSQAALARIRVDQSDDGAVAERFELYVQGVELANGYHELRDAEEMERRFRTINQRRAMAGKVMLPVHSRLAQAMRRGFPNCAGVALGFDRLVMLATDSTCLADVLAFPVDRA